VVGAMYKVHREVFVKIKGTHRGMREGMECHLQELFRTKNQVPHFLCITLKKKNIHKRAGEKRL
jgi:hypothetical protein